MTMSGTHTEAVLNRLTKPELAQLLLNTEATLGSQITDLSKEFKDTHTYFKKFEADIADVRTVNDRLVQRVVKTETQCWENIPDETHWRLLAFQILLIIVTLRKPCMVSSKRLVSKLTNRMFKTVIA